VFQAPPQGRAPTDFPPMCLVEPSSIST
jgi:hypothetical protein